MMHGAKVEEFDAERMQVHAHLQMGKVGSSNPTHFQRPVNLESAKIDGSLEMEGVQFDQKVTLKGAIAA